LSVALGPALVVLATFTAPPSPVIVAVPVVAAGAKEETAREMGVEVLEV
jgi:hypothetical protein